MVVRGIRLGILNLIAFGVASGSGHWPCPEAGFIRSPDCQIADAKSGEGSCGRAWESARGETPVGGRIAATAIISAPQAEKRLTFGADGQESPALELL